MIDWLIDMEEGSGATIRVWSNPDGPPVSIKAEGRSPSGNTFEFSRRLDPGQRVTVPHGLTGGGPIEWSIHAKGDGE